MTFSVWVMENKNDSVVHTKASSHSAEPFVLDIRPIFACGASPCSHIDQAVASLKKNQNLVLIAPFEPLPLFTKLAAQGFQHESEAQPDGSWRILFKRTGKPVSAQSAP